MKKIILLFTALITIAPSFAQDNMPQQWLMRARILQVDQSDVSAFEKAVAKKTEMYNNKEDQPRWITFRILSGPQANNYLRMQLTTDVSEFDNEDMKGNAYWEKTVGPLHTSLGNRYWARNNWSSYVPEDPQPQTHRRIIYYNYIVTPTRRVCHFVLVCNSGCNGNVVQVRFHHDGFTGQSSDYGEPLQNMIASYNEIYGDDSYAQDSAKMAESLEENGRSIRHHEYLPELSSNW